MKKLILISAAVLIASMAQAQMTASVYAQERKQNLKEDKDQMHSIMQLERTGDFQAYIKGAQEEVAGNEKRLVALRDKMMNMRREGGKQSEKAAKKLEKNIIILEKFNSELQTDLKNYMEYGEGDWKLFKREFNQDLADLGNELRDLRHTYTEFIADNLK